MATVSVRYIVNDVDAAIDFYCRNLGFREEMHPAPTFAMLSRGDLRLLLSAPSGLGGGGQAMPDGTKPEPGGWNRISLEVTGLPAMVETQRESGFSLPERPGDRHRREPDPAGRPVGQPGRAVRTTRPVGATAR
jgi:catechol 2,3-dioxygenase-like lactoylglutathione lyase family enzyme